MFTAGRLGMGMAMCGWDRSREEGGGGAGGELTMAWRLEEWSALTVCLYALVQKDQAGQPSQSFKDYLKEFVPGT